MLKKLIGPLALILAVVVVYTLIKNKSRPVSSTESQPASITLPVTVIAPSPHPMIMTAEGFIKPRWQTTISAEVSGRVIDIKTAFLVGNQFQAGEELIDIEPLDYAVQLSRAEANLKAAEANLTEQQMQAQRAKSDWNKLNPNREPSLFNLRIPQLRNAEANLAAANSELKLAQRNLERTTIKAPFDGFTLSRNVDLGEIIQTGSLLGEVANNNELELRVSLKSSQVKQLRQASTITINVTADGTDTELNYSELRIDPFIDDKSRWQSVTVVIDAAQQQFLVGEFLQLQIKAESNQDFLALPETALSIDGRIWYVDDQRQTAFFKPNVIFKSQGKLFLRPEQNLNYPLSVIVSPSSSLLAGTTVVTDEWQPLVAAP